MLPPEPEAAKSVFHTAREQIGRAQSHRSPANARATETPPRPHDIASRILPEPASSPPATRPRQTARPHARNSARNSFARASCFLTSKHMSDYIRPGIGQQGYQRCEDRQIRKQGEIARQRRLPCQLSDSRQAAQSFHRNRRSDRNAYRHPRDRENRRTGNGKHMPEQNA